MPDYKVTELAAGIDFDNLPYWDVVIIGAGPAGLAAALTTAHRGLTTLVIEAKDKAGGQPQFLYADKKIVDVPGFPDGIRGDELSARVYRQAVDALVQFRFQEELVTIEDTDQVEKEDPLKRVVSTRDEYLCRKVIIACGLLHYPRRLPVLDALESKKVFYKIPKIGDYDGHGVVIVGGGDSAFDAAVMAIERGASVDVLCRDEPIAKADTVARVVPQLVEKGEYTPPRLGIRSDPRIAARVSAQTGVKGLVIMGVDKGSGAEAAGIQPAEVSRRGFITPRDYLMAVDERETPDIDSLQRALDAHKPGDKVKLKILRDGKVLEKEAVLK